MPWLALGAALVAVQAAKTVRKRHQLRHIPVVDGHVPILGRVKTLAVRSTKPVC